VAVFLSFHYDRDAQRAQQTINMGAIEEQTILNPQDWEAVKKQGKAAIETWIDDQMKYKTAVVVLVGAETASREWVKYEIAKAWDDKRPLVGVRIHGLKNLSEKTDTAGANPFAEVSLKSGKKVSDYVTLHNPAGADSKAVYASIKANLKAWADGAYKRP
jgi:MTH538 TIR-like domain (DUF1863).